MKKKIAVIMGGYSSEYEISIGSGEAVMMALADSDYDATQVLILKDRWVAVENGVEMTIDKNDFSFLRQDEKITFDGVFNAIHGTPGEDGLMQAYFEIVNMKHTSCDFFGSALTFNKSKTNAIVSRFGVNCAKGMYFTGNDIIDENELAENLGFPLFVKPSRSGSSYGITRVTELAGIKPAIDEAKKEDSDIVVEAAVLGIEVGCGVARLNGKVEVLAITEIVSKNAFFDFQAKYEGASEEITPARIASEIQNEIEENSIALYEKLELKGVIRVDYIIEESTNRPVFIEVNTVPGLSPASIVPKQLEYKGYSQKEFFTLVLKETLKS
jgi:D-alanine-D-alanine ligase